MVQDNVASFTAPQLAAMCGAYVQLCRHSYNDSQLFDVIVEQVLRSFKVWRCQSRPLLVPEAGPEKSSQLPGAVFVLRYTSVMTEKTLPSEQVVIGQVYDVPEAGIAAAQDALLDATWHAGSGRQRLGQPD